MSAVHFHIDPRRIADMLGVASGQLVGPDSERYRIDLTNPVDARAKLAPAIAKADALHGGGKMTETARHDAASVFSTTALTQVLAPVQLVSSTRYLFTPGYTNGGPLILPVEQKVPLGMQELSYQVLANTGEAKLVAHGATRRIPLVGTIDDEKKQPVVMFGVAFEFDQFELWRAAHLGRSPQVEYQRAASTAMAEYFEQFASYGNTDVGCPGFFNHGSTTTINLSINPGSATAAEALDLFAYMDYCWYKLSPNRILSGVVMPKGHQAHLAKLFLGASQEGQNAWKWAKETYPWLNNITMDDRLKTASPDGFSMWQFWSADSESQYLEANPTPMLYGPFMDDLRTRFIMLNQIGGVVNKDPRAIMRVQMPS